MFPIKIVKQSARHRGGTKDYHIVIIETNDGRALVINRWGPKEKWGQMRVDQFDSIEDARKAFNAKHREKFEHGGYENWLSNATHTANNEKELREKLGLSYSTQIGAKNLEFLIPGIDTTGVRDPKEVEWEKTPDGRFVPKDKPALKNAEAERQEVETIYASNDQWGSY